MIAVVGHPAYEDREGGARAAGLAVDVADAAVRGGRRVEIVGKVGDDGAGDAVVVDLGRRGIGHAALLRDPSHGTPLLVTPAAEGDGGEPQTRRLLPEDAGARPSLDGADVDLALHYLPDVKTVVVAGPLETAAVSAAIEAARFAGTRLVVVAGAGESLPDLPPDATALEAPGDDDGSFGRMVGEFAASLDAGQAPADAFRGAVAAAGWESVED